MKKERLKVLEMVESGKISVEEASKLLEALKSSTDLDWEPDYDDAEEKLNQFSKNVDAFAKDFSDKFSSTFKEVEPKLRAATKTVIEKTVSIIDDISKSLNETAKNLDNKEECCSCGCSEEPSGDNADDEPKEN